MRIRRTARRIGAPAWGLVALLTSAWAAEPSGPANFDAFLAKLWPDAKAAGITRVTFDKAFARLSPDPRVMALTAKQPEYLKAVGDYVNGVATKARIQGGSAQAKKWGDTLAAVEAKFKVDRWVMLAVWGIESNYGAVPLKWDIIRSLATLAEAGYRDPYFRKELLLSLQILQNGDVPRDGMMGSWAGAMGQPQFMPSVFLEYATDFSGDGHRDIWKSVPDVLASMANYLGDAGWQAGQTWGYEVVVPPGFDYSRSRGTFAEWSNLGVKRADSGPFPASGNAIMFFPSGSKGPAFLVTPNFDVLKRYNNSDVYALAVGLLSDQLQGLGPFRTPWPKSDPQLSREQRIALQKKLAALGYHVREFGGHIDFDLRDDIRKEQIKYGMVPDGHPTAGLLDHLGIKAP